jgi:transcriptional regulator with XRE-family HTH domain
MSKLYTLGQTTIIAPIMFAFVNICKILHPKMNDTFGERLAAQRDQLGMSQSDLCALTSVKRGAQSKYENDKSFPDVRYLTILMQHGFDVMYLLSGEEAARRETIDEQLLKDVLIVVEAEIAKTSSNVQPEKKASLVALTYKAFRLSGKIDADFVAHAVKLIS